MELKKIDDDISAKLESIKEKIIEAVVGHLGDAAILIILEIDGNILDFSNLDLDDHVGLMEAVTKSHKSGNVYKKRTEYLSS